MLSVLVGLVNKISRKNHVVIKVHFQTLSQKLGFHFSHLFTFHEGEIKNIGDAYCA